MYYLIVIELIEQIMYEKEKLIVLPVIVLVDHLNYCMQTLEV